MGYVRDHKLLGPSEATWIRDHSEIYTFFGRGIGVFLNKMFLDNAFIF